jgi:hypothetical protein
MRRIARRLMLLGALVSVVVGIDSSSANGCQFTGGCGEAGLEDGDVTVAFGGKAVGALVAGDAGVVDYAWRLRRLCVLSDEETGTCSAQDFRPCPAEVGRTVEYLVVQRRPIVRSDMTSIDGPVPSGFEPGDFLGTWQDVRVGCIDITSLNPPPSPGEVFSYFERLPLPTLTTQHQPPDDGLSGLPVIFYTDSPTTQTFTVNM